MNSDKRILVSCKTAINHAVFGACIYDFSARNGEKLFHMEKKIASLKEQLHAMAVNNYCDLCPLFKCDVVIPNIEIGDKPKTKFW